MSREYFKHVYLKENPPVDLSVPGPGSYQMKSDIANDYSVKFSMRPRTAMNSAFQNFTKNNPGPGAYNHISQAKDKAGNTRAVFSYHSRMKSSGGVAISRGGPRFDRSLLRASIDNPGPGRY